MSRQPKNLQGEVSTKKQIISIIIITALVFGIWWSATGIIDLFSGGSRSGYATDEDLRKIDGGTYQQDPIGEPSYPGLDVNIGDLTPELLQQLLEMMAGNLDRLNPAMMASILGANPELLNQVMFRIYDYPNIADVQSQLFRYSVFDTFSNSEWTKSSTIESPTVYQNNYILPDVTAEYRIRMPFEEITSGQEYSSTIPGLSPDTSIRTGSVQAQNPALDPSSIQTPFVDIFGVKSLKPTFTTNNAQNLSLRTWGFRRSGGSIYYNITTRVNPSIIPAAIRDQYLKFPGGVTATQYRDSRPAFAAVTVDIQNRFNTNPSANLFVKANMIRNYMRDAFVADPLTPSEATDIVEDACQTRVGDYFGIASTFIMLARFFQIPTRFVTGYSGNLAAETVDPMGNPSYSGPANTAEIKLLNMYAWAETFMPLQDDGSGDWVPMDVLEVGFADGYSDGLPSNDVIRIFVDGAEFNPAAPMHSIDRPATVNITVYVTTDGAPYNGTVTLFDLLEEQTLCSITATNGRGEFLWDVNTTVIAGGHAFRATAGNAMNFSAVGVRGPINLEFVDRVPDTIDRTTPNQDLRVTGYLEDLTYTGSRPTNRIPKANITVSLLTNPGNIPVPTPFNPGTIKTNETGEFETNVTLDSSVVQGLYNARLNFPGLFTYNIPGIGMASALVDSMTAISVTKSLQVIDPNQVVFEIFLNGTDNSVYDTLYNEGNQINATAHILVGGSPFVVSVRFDIQDNRDSVSSFFMGSSTTNAQGWANVTWTVPPTSYTGPAVVRAQFDLTGLGDIRSAYAFCFINRSTKLYLNTITPDTIVDVNSNPYLGFIANINDTNSRAVVHAAVGAVIYDKGSNPSSFDILPSNVIFTNVNGNAIWSSASTYVQGSGNYTYYDLRTEFYASYDYNGNPWAGISGLSPGVRYVPGATTNNSLKREIFITDSSAIDMCNLWVNGTPAAAVYSDANIGIFNTGAIINFTAQCRKGGTFQSGERVDFNDVTAGNVLLGTRFTNGIGIATLSVVVPSSWIAGPHEITMTYRPTTGQRSNFTVVFINDTIHLANSQIYVDQPKIMRGVTTVHVTGALKDVNNQGVYKASVNLKLFNSIFTEQFGYLSGITPVITDTNGNFSFTVTIANTLLQGAYKFRVDFGQVIDANSFSNCPTYLIGINKLNPVQSPYADITVNATIGISGAYYTPVNQLRWSNISVYGTFRWDNNTALSSTSTNWLTIRITETGNPSNILSTTMISPSDIDGSGNVMKSINVTWSVADWTVTWVLVPVDIYVSQASWNVVGV